VTSDTALALPVAELVARARDAGLVTVVDGAHAPAQVPLDLDALGADFYAANCHKWLCAPKGAGFLHVRGEHQGAVEALIVSWGFGESSSFLSRNEWQGTRDPSAYLTVPDAIRWVEEHDDAARGHGLAVEAQQRLTELVGTEPLSTPEFIARMAAVRVPGDADLLKARLYDAHRIEVPMRPHPDGALLRVSFAAYNDESDLDSLAVALERELRTDS
jgi:isopenicillin-N epimerase